ncbi:trehalase family glycosidase, partial [Psychrobacter sp. TAE2020]|uniref:trehalase family glycosidase n=1 Tax=Psychrobacter sp. TAE2020 TaxID=2846762 RepID=UPI00226B8352
MVKNFAYLIDTVGFIPNGNRNYYLTRSQPPFFSVIVSLLEDYDSLAADHYLDQMLTEYKFWMNGAETLRNPGEAFEHSVILSDGTLMNRYYDRGETPRPEAYKEDYHLAKRVGGDDKNYIEISELPLNPVGISA